MKVLYCDICETYQAEAYVGVTVFSRMKLTDSGWVFSDPDFDFPTKPFTDVDLSECRCFEYEHKLEIIEVENCPHNWRQYPYDTERVCRICGIVQRGSVVYE